MNLGTLWICLMSQEIYFNKSVGSTNRSACATFNNAWYLTPKGCKGSWPCGHIVLCSLTQVLRAGPGAWIMQGVHAPPSPSPRIVTILQRSLQISLRPLWLFSYTRLWRLGDFTLNLLDFVGFYVRVTVRQYSWSILYVFNFKQNQYTLSCFFFHSFIPSVLHI